MANHEDREPTRDEVETGREAVLRVLENRFGGVPIPLTMQINRIHDEATLSELHRASSLVGSLEEFAGMVDEVRS